MQMCVGMQLTHNVLSLLVHVGVCVRERNKRERDKKWRWQIVKIMDSLNSIKSGETID